MAFIVVRLARRHAGRERQNRLRAIQRLNLTLFIDAEHNRAIWRIFRAHGVHIPVPQRDLRMVPTGARGTQPGGASPGAPGRDRAAD